PYQRLNGPAIGDLAKGIRSCPARTPIRVVERSYQRLNGRFTDLNALIPSSFHCPVGGRCLIAARSPPDLTKGLRSAHAHMLTCVVERRYQRLNGRFTDRAKGLRSALAHINVLVVEQSYQRLNGYAITDLTKGPRSAHAHIIAPVSERLYQRLNSSAIADRAKGFRSSPAHITVRVPERLYQRLNSSAIADLAKGLCRARCAVRVVKRSYQRLNGRFTDLNALIPSSFHCPVGGRCLIPARSPSDLTKGLRSAHAHILTCVVKRR